jgi:hypothetical protein
LTQLSRTWRPRLAASILGLAALCSGNAHGEPTPKSRVVAAGNVGAATTAPMESSMWMTVGGRRFAITLADTDAARAFAARLPMTLDMTDLHDNEKKFDLSENLPANPIRPGTIRQGDLMLWGDNTVVVFYKTFDSPYSYTRLGRADDPTGLAQAVGRGDVRVQFSAQK